MVSVKCLIESAGVVEKGHFVLADGGHALRRLEMDRLWEHPKLLASVLDLLGTATGLPEADLIVGVPTGGQRLALELARTGRVQVPVIELERVPGGAKQDFRFLSEADAEQVRTVRSVRIYEDVVTTLSSIAGVVRLLDPNRQDIHSLAIWRRGEVKPAYKLGVQDHYLHEELIPVFTEADCPVCNPK